MRQLWVVLIVLCVACYAIVWIQPKNLIPANFKVTKGTVTSSVISIGNKKTLENGGGITKDNITMGTITSVENTSATTIRVSWEASQAPDDAAIEYAACAHLNIAAVADAKVCMENLVTEFSASATSADIAATDLAGKAFLNVVLRLNGGVIVAYAPKQHTFDAPYGRLRVGSTGCYISTSGLPYCWGQGAYGGLGTGSTADIGKTAGSMGTSLQPIPLLEGHTIKDLQLSIWGSACALTDEGKMICWGLNNNGCLGLGTTDQQIGEQAADLNWTNEYFVNLGTGETVKQFDLGYNRVCAELNSGKIKCWGAKTHIVRVSGGGDAFDLGNSPDHMGDNLAAAGITYDGSLVKLALGQFHTCALFDTGKVKCWGAVAQLGYDDFARGKNYIGTQADLAALPYLPFPEDEWAA